MSNLFGETTGLTNYGSSSLAGNYQLAMGVENAISSFMGSNINGIPDATQIASADPMAMIQSMIEAMCNVLGVDATATE